MIHRIARAIHASLADLPPREADTAWDQLADAERTPYFLTARRVLTILRNPTDAMLRDGNLGSARDAANIWEAMIFRALNEWE